MLSAHHPVPLLAQQLRNGTRGQMVVREERLHDASLVQNREGAQRRVGHQHQPLVVDGGQGPLHDRWDALMSGFTPALEALEAIQDLIVAIAGRHHPQRPVGQPSVRRRQPPGTQVREAAADAIDGKLADDSGGLQCTEFLAGVELAWAARLTSHGSAPATVWRARRTHPGRCRRCLRRTATAQTGTP